MKAVRFAAAGVAGMADLDLPGIRPGHALVRVRAAGLCHTDIEVLHGRYGVGAFPLVPGHEYAGTVEAVADDVTTVKPGDRVAVDPNIPCGHCAACRKGLTNLCATLKAYGVTENGGFAEYSLVKAGHLHAIGDLDFATAALAEPLACVLNGLGAAGVEASRPQSALVFGAGPIGLLLALSLKAKGVGKVAVADISEQRLAFAEALGLEPLVSGSQALSARARGFDFVADATGVAKVVEGMIGFAADGGTVLVFGVCAPEARISVAPFEIFRRQIRLAGSHSLNRNIPQALDILSRDDGTMVRLVSHRLPLAELLPFFAKSSGDPATMKVQFTAEA
ncbi:MAG: zinc-dependent alcohol dehydrogenase family protein [Mesorhizobium sp.]|uniref:zinc-dependent alcohol dehydrogenase family protein n=1 Tax=Mesorhizobium sp. TaxID=1871066 RepID=UPI001ACEF9CA|nr:zinc-dependent alcohol dehydrogenase family protein [Mesorhizobium sp.]MBN9218998.1 zinc-dependent alcohol dehydrogenase family protein [Mesorhizobium sp.]